MKASGASVNLQTKEACDRCGRLADVVYTERLRQRGRIGRHAHLTCPSCGRVREAEFDVFGPETRALLLRAHGEWELIVDASLVVRALAVLRRKTGLSVSDAKKARSGRRILSRGTQVEMLAFQLELEADGVTADIERRDSAV